MKLVIRAPMKGDEICSLLDGYSKDGVKFSFEKKEGITLTFDVQGENTANACAAAKEAIKATAWGKVLYCSIEAK